MLKKPYLCVTQALLKMFWICFSLLGLVIAAESADVAVSNRLSQQLCNYVDSSTFQRVLPPSAPGSVCPVYEKDGSQSQWSLNNCRPFRTLDEDGANENTPSEDLSAGEGGKERLINAHEAPPFSHPYIIYARGSEQGMKGISGTIYNAYTIITHAEILKEMLSKVNGSFEAIRIHIGKHNHTKRENEEQLRFMCNYTYHPKYNGSNYYYYTALHLYDPITLSRFADRVSLAKAKGGIPTISKDCLVPGWGATKQSGPGSNYTSKTLQEASVTIQDCNVNVQENEFCSNDTYCWSDTGSPLICTDNDRIYASGIMSTLTKCGIGRTVYGDLKRDDVHE